MSETAQFCACNSIACKLPKKGTHNTEVCGNEAVAVIEVPEREVFKQLTVNGRDEAKHRYALARPHKVRLTPLCAHCLKVEQARQKREGR